MRLTWVKADRNLWLPPWALALVAIWIAGILIAWAVERWRPDVALGPTCLFRRLTDTPCLTCGATRATFALASADFAGALVYNPLVTLALLAAAGLLAARLGFARRPELDLSTGGRRLAAAVLLAAAVANWVYLILASAS